MTLDATRTNLLIVMAMGVAMFVLGLLLYLNGTRIAPYMRYLLPMPPIAVAAYIYVLNAVNAKGGPLTLKDMVLETAIGTAVFVLITGLLLVAYYVISVLSNRVG